MTTRRMIGICVLGLGLGLVAQAAQAGEGIDIGGKSSVTAIGSVTTIDPDKGEDVTALILGGVAAYTTESGRFELGGGLTMVGAFSDIGDAAVYSLTGQARVNTDPLGPEENLLLYAGGIAGLGILRGDGIVDDEVGVFGPKAGLEFYLSPRTAIQVQDAVLFDTEGGLSNQLTLGFKLLFN